MTTAEMKQELDKLNERIKQLEAELERAENEPEFKRVPQHKYYYTIQLDDVCRVIIRREEYWSVDDNYYDLPNYFYTKERAQEVADKIKFLLKLERLHDIYCPDYKPDLEKKTHEHKYCVYYDHIDDKYRPDLWTRCANQPTVYFPTREIAQKVCDILNKYAVGSHKRRLENND